MARFGKVYDAQTVRTETNMTERNYSTIVGTAMRLKLAHPADDAQVVFFRTLSRQTDQSGYSTHIIPLDSLSDSPSCQLDRRGRSHETLSGKLTRLK